VFLIFSCSYDRDDTILVNDSSTETVAVKFGYTDEISLAPGTSTSFGTKKFGGPVYYRPDKRVAWEAIPSGNGGATYIFTDRTPYTVDVQNDITDTGVSASLYADGWLENDTGNNDILDIPSGVTKTGKIYTDNPKFTATRSDGKPAIIEITVDAFGSFSVRIW
jgi:hypothetical protein